MERKSIEKVLHSISRITYEYYVEDHTGRPCVYKPGISVPLLASIDRSQLRVVMVWLWKGLIQSR